jgi:hypothetical protein
VLDIVAIAGHLPHGSDEGLSTAATMIHDRERQQLVGSLTVASWWGRVHAC